MMEKDEIFAGFFHANSQLKKEYGEPKEYDYNKVDKLDRFTGSHPTIMKEIIAKKDWEFTYLPGASITPLRHRILNKIEELTGYRIGEYKNYKLIGKVR